MRAILPVAALLVVLAACDTPTAPRDFADGSVHFVKELNPQPLPRGRHFSSASVPGSGRATASACFATGLYQPPDPCLR